MNYLMSQLTAGAYVIAVKDTYTWDITSYTNMYVLQRPEQTILIVLKLLKNNLRY